MDAVKYAAFSASLTLSENIDINLKIAGLGTDKNGAGFDISGLAITVDGTSWTDYTVEDDTLSGVLKAVDPKDMGNSLQVVVNYDGIQIKKFTYSVKNYCDAVFAAQKEDKNLEKPTGNYDKLAELCEAILNYGKYAEDYYNEKEYNNSTDPDKEKPSESTISLC